MSDGEMEGMQTFDKELEKLIRNGVVKKEIAMGYASNANNLALAISDLDETKPTTRTEAAAPVSAPMPPAARIEMPQIEGFEP